MAELPPGALGLGALARDRITGFEGTVTARAEYLGQVGLDLRLTAHTGPAGDLKERWVGESRLELAPERPIGLGSRPAA